MKAAVFYGKEQLRIENIPIPTPKKDQVLIRIAACGICGTDMHIFDGDEGAAPSPSGTVLGHEFAGTVAAIGEDVKGISIGEKVCVDPNKLCGVCDFCREGIGHFCENMIGIGTTVNGGFAEFCCVPSSQVYRCGEDLDLTAAAMCEPVACCLHGIDLCDILPGDTVLVIGGGMIGLLMLQLAAIKGAAKLILVEPIAEKRALAKQLGADLTINPLTQDVTTALAGENIGRIATVIECVGKTNTIEQAISLAGKRSTVMMFGLTAPAAEITVRPFEIFKKEIVLKASFINPYTQKRALELIKNGRIDVSSMIYQTISLEELPTLLADKKKRSLGKYIVTF